MRKLFGAGTPRGLQGRCRRLFSVAKRFCRVLTSVESLVLTFTYWRATQLTVRASRDRGVKNGPFHLALLGKADALHQLGKPRVGAQAIE